MKIFSFLILTLLISCGKPTRFEHITTSPKGGENKTYWATYALPVTIKVPKEKFEEYENILLEVQEDYKEAAGFPLIKFVAEEKVPTFENITDSKNLKTGNYLMFKEDDKTFLDVVFPTLGVTQTFWYVPSLRIYKAHIVLNFSKGELEHNLLREVLIHEVGHFLGFDHVKEVDSIMNESINYDLVGLREFDLERIRKKYHPPERYARR